MQSTSGRRPLIVGYESWMVASLALPFVGLLFSCMSVSCTVQLAYKVLNARAAFACVASSAADCSL